MDHLRNAFPTYKIQAKLKPGDNPGNADELLPPYKLTFPAQDTKRTALAAELKKDDNTTVIVEPFVRENRGPYPMNVPKQNQITFTATQIEAIRSGMQPGLTQVVGPPGTGKTDVAVQQRWVRIRERRVKNARSAFACVQRSTLLKSALCVSRFSLIFR